MRRQECKDCGCQKSIHRVKLCMGCYEIYKDNYKEYMANYGEYKGNFVSPWHPFKLDNLKYLEEIYESRSN